jgi:hypothetical protein
MEEDFFSVLRLENSLRDGLKTTNFYLADALEILLITLDHFNPLMECVT